MANLNHAHPQDWTVTPQEAAAKAEMVKDDKVVHTMMSYGGDLYAVSARGRIFMRHRDPKNFEPGEHMIWTEIEGPKF